MPYKTIGYFIRGILLSNLLTACNNDNALLQNEGEIKVEVLVKDEVPNGIIYTGTPEMILKWMDKTGENYFIGTTSTEATKQETIDGDEWEIKEKNLKASLFTNKLNNSNLVWQLNIHENCNYDLFLDFIAEATTITDIDNDSIAEVTFTYRKSCRSDISPSDIIVEMREGKDIYLLEGIGLVEGISTKQASDTLFGKYNDKHNFDKAPSGFLNHAQIVWKNAIENEYK